MNNKQKACAFLVILIGGMIYGTQQMSIKTGVAKEASKTAEQQASNNQFQLSIAETNLESIDKKTQHLRQTYDQWVPHLKGFATSQDAEARLTELIRKSRVFLISQRFETMVVSGSASNNDRDSVIDSVLKGDLVFEDDFVKTMNFLGKLEKAIPALRVTKSRLVRGDRGNNINLELSVELPIIVEPAMPEPPVSDAA